MTGKKTLITFIVCIGCFAISYVSASMVEKKEGETIGLNVLKRYTDASLEPMTLQSTYNLTENIKEINLEATNIDVSIEPCENNDCKIEYYDRKNIIEKPATFEVEGNKLIIKSAKHRHNFEINFDDGKDVGFKIYLPNNFIFKGKSTSGNFKAKDINIESLTLSGTSGDIDIDNVTTDNLTLTTTSGDQTVSGKFNIVTLTSTSGDKELSFKETTQLTAAANSGDTEVSGKVQSANLTSSSGDIEININSEIPHLTITSRSGDVSVGLPKEPNLRLMFTTRSGDLSARSLTTEKNSILNDNQFSLGKGEGNLTVTTSSGDLTLRQ